MEKNARKRWTTNQNEDRTAYSSAHKAVKTAFVVSKTSYFRDIYVDINKSGGDKAIYRFATLKIQRPATIRDKQTKLITDSDKVRDMISWAFRRNEWPRVRASVFRFRIPYKDPYHPSRPKEEISIDEY